MGLIRHSICVLSAITLTFSATAQEQAPREPEPLIREIFVPFDDLNILLEGDAKRLYLTRQEYENLVKSAKEKPPVEHAPRAATILDAAYSINVADGRATITGKLTVEVSAGGIQTLPLPIAGVGLREARLDAADAPIGINDHRQPILFVEGKGEHSLTLEMVAPMQTTAARQSLYYQLPTPPATRVTMTVPGNVEIKAGATVISRDVNDDGSQTSFELLPKRSENTIVMSLNNRTLRRQSVIAARSVIVDEVTAAYERIHATVSMAILNGATDRFRFVAPDGFAVTEVNSPLVERWLVSEVADRRELEVILREPTSDSVVLNITATRTPAVLESWKLPTLTALDVAAESAVVGLIVEDRLQAESIAYQNLIPIDNAVLTSALPESVFREDAGAPKVRPVAAYYAPRPGYELSANFAIPESQFRSTANVLLTVDETGHRVSGGFALMPEVDKRFEFSFSVPAAWHVTQINDDGGNALTAERYGSNNEDGRIQVRLPKGVMPGVVTKVQFEAERVPEGWLGEWTEKEIDFPVFAVEGAARDFGVIAVRGDDDFAVRPLATDQLSPLDENEKSKYGLQGVATDLAFRYESQPYSARISVSRKTPASTARVFSFFRVATGTLFSHHEIVFDIELAGARELRFALPLETPTTLSVNGLDDTTVKEFLSRDYDDRREWVVQLAESRRGTVRIAVDFEQLLESEELDGYLLPLARAVDVDYQSAIIAVEGIAELDVSVATEARPVDVGELVTADYRVGRRLLGVYSMVGPAKPITMDVHRRPGYGIPPAIVQRAELLTLVSASGVSQTAARYQMMTKAPYLEIDLPGDAALWSVLLDGKPVAPQRDGQRLLLSLPTAETGTPRDLRIVYELPIGSIGLTGNIDAAAPVLLLRGEADSEVGEVPTADLVWRIILPKGHQLVRSHGTVFTDEIRQRPSPLVRAAGALYFLLGGVDWFYQDSAHGLAKSIAPAAGEAFRLDEGVQYESQSAGDSNAGFGGDMDMEDPFAAPSDLTLDIEADSPSQAETPAEIPAAEPDPAKPVPPKVTPPTPSRQPTAERGADGESEQAGQGQAPQPRDDLFGDQTEQARKKGKANDFWALQGMRSLQIDLQSTGDEITFRSLGLHPRLDVTLVNRWRFQSLAWGVGLIVLLIGICRTCRTLGSKTRYILAIASIALVIPVVTGLDSVWGDVFDMAFYAACLLVPFYLVAGCCCWLAKRCKSCCPGVTTTAALLLFVSVVPNDGAAQELDIEKLLRRLAPIPPVKLPADAVIIPYQADDKLDAIKNAEKVLVPYDKYVELWDRAFPDKKLRVDALPADYSLAGASFAATLAGEDYLLVTGRLNIDVFTDKPVQVALPLEGGVLASAMIDGKPARLKLIEAEPMAPNSANMAPREMQQQADIAPTVRADSYATLYLSGKGRKTLNLAIRIKLERRGGWRIAEGRLPAAPAAGLTLTAPDAGTEVRLTGIPDREEIETDTDDQELATALDVSGQFKLQWRPKVAEGQVDRSLTAASNAILDVQEDGLQLIWRTELSFPRSRRDAFALFVPSGYLIEQVVGENVRGWRVEQDDDQQRVDVTLLKEVADRESITLLLSNRRIVATDQSSEFLAPVVSVDGAVLHKGRMTVRRSPLLELETGNTAGLARTDIDQDSLQSLAQTLETVTSPLPLRIYQTYQFSGTPFSLNLTSTPVSVDSSARVQTLLKVADRETTMETRVVVEVGRRPVHRVRVYLPATLEIDRVEAPGGFQWSTTNAENDRQLLSIQLDSGQSDSFSVVAAGSLGRRRADDPIAVPKVEALDVTRQSGDIVIQADPAFRISIPERTGCTPLELSRVHSWLVPNQRILARAALRYNDPGYSATVQLTAKIPQVSGYTVSNVKVTNVAVEETIIINMTILEAGIRQVVFQLPSQLRQAKIQVPMLRETTIEDIDDSTIRVRLELQDEIIGQLGVLVENDRLLASLDDAESETLDAPIPVLETGRTDQRYVTIENAGRDEVLVERQDGLDALGRQSSEWRKLAGILGDAITTAYLVRGDSQAPRLSFKTKQRKTVETAGASIGLAETVLVMDASGVYRARQTYHVNNTTEQYLVTQLPADCELWSAIVAGDPVKPTTVPGGKANEVRIPLIKTAEGENDYLVVLKYGGPMPKPGAWRKVTFPLIRTSNINVELSQVRLYLPPSHRWFNFGGTMRRLFDEGEYQAGFLEYSTNAVKRWMRVASSDNPYARLRAANNLKQIGMAFENYDQTDNPLMSNEAFNYNYRRNAEIVQQAQQQTEQLLLDSSESMDDNRARLNSFFDGQTNGLARNVVNDLGGNFNEESTTGKKVVADKDEAFRYEWLESNKLENPKAASLADQKGDEPSDGKPASTDATGKSRFSTKSSNAPQSETRLRSALEFSGRGGDKPQEQGETAQQAHQSRGMSNGQQLSQRDLARVYQAELEKDAEPSSGLADLNRAPASRPNAGAQPPVGGRVNVNPLLPEEETAATRTAVASGEETPIAVADHLASLDVQLPKRGTEYLFTTPRGEIEITAYAVASPLYQRMIYLGCIALLAIALWIGYRIIRVLAPILGRSRIFFALVLVASICQLFSGLFPIAAAIFAAIGLVQLIRLTPSTTTRASTTAS